VSADADDRALLRQVIDYYHDTLKQSPEALDYLRTRGLDHPEMIERFKLGFANRTLGLRLPDKSRRSGAELRSALQRIGLLRTSGHEHFNGSLVIPVLTAAGDVTEVYGRKIRDDLRPGTPAHLYLPGPHRGVWNAEALQASKEIILTEALIDALTFWCAGFRNVTAAYGVEGFTDDHLTAFQRHGIERVLIAFDRDEAGERGAEKVASQLMSAGIACFRIQFPKGMDANAYALKLTPAAKSLGLVIRKAVWLGQGVKPLSVARSSLLETECADEQALSGSEGVAERDRSGADRIRGDQGIPEVRDLCTGGPDTPGGGIDSRKHCRGPGAATSEGVSATPVDCQGQSGGTAYAADRGPASGVSDAGSAPGTGSEAGRRGPTPARLAPQPQARRATDNEQRVTALPAFALPDPPAPEDAAEVTDSEVTLRFGDRRWRVRGLPKNLAYDTLKVNLLVACGDAFHVDTLDLYSARARAGFIAQAATELHQRDETIKADLGRVLLKLERLQDGLIRAALTPAEPAAVTIGEVEREAALALLKAPDLLTRIVADLTACGLVGEDTNKLAGYLAAVSRKLARPLAVLVQSASAAGKSSLMDAVLAFMPEEERIKYSAMTGQSLFYMGETSLKHKILAIVEEEGASRAAYALKLLQSEGELTIASTGKDPATGNLVTRQYRVEGPVMIFLTTTAIEIDEELLNRCLVLSVDESREQTQAIHRLQRARRTLDGLQAQQARAQRQTLHQNAQRLLRPLAVVNPYADALTFLDDRTRTRRDHEKYLTLIDTIALLHQYQREVKQTGVRSRESGESSVLEYLEVTPEDIAQANRLAHDMLGRSLDELPPQTRRLLRSVCAWVDTRTQAQAQAMRRADFRFSRREVRDATGWGDTQLRLHLDRLVQLEYLLVHRGSRGQSFVYELLYDGPGDAQPHLSGLLDAAHLAATTPTSRGQTPDLAGSMRPASGADAGASRSTQTPATAGGMAVCTDDAPEPPKPQVTVLNGKTRSYPQPAARPAVAAVGR
jgi:hypothetical protein